MERNESKFVSDLDEFLKDFNKDKIELLFYSLSYEKLVNFIPLLIENIEQNNVYNKEELYAEISRLIQYFMINSIQCAYGEVQTSIINKQMKNYLIKLDELVKIEKIQIIPEDNKTASDSLGIHR